MTAPFESLAFSYALKGVFVSRKLWQNKLQWNVNWVRVVNRTIVDSEWCFDNLCNDHHFYHHDWWWSVFPRFIDMCIETPFTVNNSLINKEILSHVYGKRQRWTCTTCPNLPSVLLSFTMNCFCKMFGSFIHKYCFGLFLSSHFLF